MNIISLYRRLVSQKRRDEIYNLFLGDFLFFIRTLNPRIHSKFIYWFRFFISKSELNDAYAFMGKFGLTNYPFTAALNYQVLDINVFHDEENGLPYVVHNNNKLYFPKSYEDLKIIDLYKNLLLEQDINSPHRYVCNYRELEGKTLLDIGAAEGIFSLDTINFTSKVYLFECKEIWIEALSATFKPWKDKVCVINKYVSNTDHDENITLDSFLVGKDDENLFLKMDIEGAEQSALRGAKRTLTIREDISMAVCTYHKKEDARVISNDLSAMGYDTTFTFGYLFWMNMMNKAILRASK